MDVYCYQTSVFYNWQKYRYAKSILLYLCIPFGKTIFGDITIKSLNFLSPCVCIPLDIIRRKTLRQFRNISFCFQFPSKLKKLNSVAWASELYRPSDHCLLAKLVRTFADRGCHVVGVTDTYGRILGFLDRSRYFFFIVQTVCEP
jgi:hypothetical protein